MSDEEDWPPPPHPLALRERRDGEQRTWRFAEDDPAIIRQRLEVLASYAPIFTDPAFDIGSYSDGYRKGDGTFVRGGFDYSAAVMHFTDELYRVGWVDMDAPWGAWKSSAEGQHFSERFDEAVRSASALQLHKTLTAICRTDRFSEGEIENAFLNGWMRRIAERAAELVSK